MNLQHAPGPWRIQHPTARQRRTYIRANERGVAVAQVGARIDRDGNAALIAAAPDLLAALREIAEADHPDSPLSRAPVTEHEFGERLMRVARAAIAKAEGRT